MLKNKFISPVKPVLNHMIWTSSGHEARADEAASSNSKIRPGNRNI